MSWEATSYVLGIKVGDSTRKLVLFGYANHAHADGTAAFPAVATIAGYAECSKRTVQRHVKALVAEGFMREGDQQLVAHYPVNARPIVYDIAMSAAQQAEWQAYHAAGANALRESAAALGRRGGEASAQVRRGDKMSPPATTSNGAPVGGDKMSPPVGGDTRDATGVTPVAPGGDTGVTQTTQEPPQGTSPSSSDPLRGPDPTNEVGHLNEGRDDVERVCQHLRQRMIDNECKPPTITKAWRDAARLLMDADRRSEQQVHNMIEWATRDSFWKANVLSMPTLREKYDQMRLQATREFEARGTRGPAYDGEKVWGPRPGADAAAPAAETAMSEDEARRFYGLDGDSHPDQPGDRFDDHQAG